MLPILLQLTIQWTLRELLVPQFHRRRCLRRRLQPFAKQPSHTRVPFLYSFINTHHTQNWWKRIWSQMRVSRMLAVFVLEKLNLTECVRQPKWCLVCWHDLFTDISNRKSAMLGGKLRVGDMTPRPRLTIMADDVPCNRFVHRAHCFL